MKYFRSVQLSKPNMIIKENQCFAIGTDFLEHLETVSAVSENEVFIDEDISHESHDQHSNQNFDDAGGDDDSSDTGSDDSEDSNSSCEGDSVEDSNPSEEEELSDEDEYVAIPNKKRKEHRKNRKRKTRKTNPPARKRKADISSDNKITKRLSTDTLVKPPSKFNTSNNVTSPDATKRESPPWAPRKPRQYVAIPP